MKTKFIETGRLTLAASLIVMLLAGCGQTDQEGIQSNKVGKSAPKVAITTSSDEARDFYMQGRALSDDLLFVEANQLFSQAVQADDGFAMGYYMKAITAQTAAEFFEAAKKANERAAAASDGEQLYIQGLVAASENDQAGQREALEKLEATYPQDERTHVTLGNFLNGQQDFAGAVTHYNHAIAIAPEFASAYNSLGYAHRSLDDLDNSRMAFEKYVGLIPHEANPYDSLAELLMEMGLYDESIENYSKALDINEFFAASYAGISTNYSLKGDSQQAQETADRMLAAARTFAERQGALFTSVTSHLFAGDTDAAMNVSHVMLAEAEVQRNYAAMGGVSEYMGDIMLASDDAAKAKEYFDAALDHRLQADINDANKDQAKRTHLFKSAIAAMVADEDDAAASLTAKYGAAALARGTSFEKRRSHELSAYLAMRHEENEAAAKHFEQASQLEPIALYWSAVANRDLGNMEKARDLAMRAANRNTLSPNMPFFRANAVELLAELSTM